MENNQNNNKDNIIVDDKDDDLSSKMQKRINVTNDDVDRLMKLFGKFNCTTVWSKVKRDDFTVRRFELGLVGDICCCELTSDAVKRFELKPGDDNDDDCTGIVVKYKNAGLTKAADVSEDSWIDVNTILVAISQIGLTPRLVYVDQQCSVQEYIPSRSCTYEDDCDLETVKQLARILARIHCLRLPLSNNSFTMWKFYEMYENRFLKNDLENYNNNTIYLEHLKRDTQERKDKYYETLAQMKLKELYLFSTNLARKVDSPVMMIHGDFTRTNQLIRENIQNNNNDDDDGDGGGGDGGDSGKAVFQKAKKDILIIDLEFAGYAYRGIDLGNYFANYKSNDHLYGMGNFPSDAEMEIFLNEYRAECIQLQGSRFGNDARNSLEHLILETKTFTLAKYALSLMFTLDMYKPNSATADYFLSSAINSYQGFQILKTHFTNDESIEHILRQ